MKRLILCLLLLGAPERTLAEIYQCSFTKGGIEHTETLSREDGSFFVARDWSDGRFEVDIIRETSGAIFLLEDFQHLTIQAGEDSGSFLLRVIDRQTGGYIWTNQRFADSSRDFHYRGTCAQLEN